MPRIAKTKHGRVRWWVDGKATTRLKALMADPDRVLQGSGSVARQRIGRKRFFRVEGGPGEPALFVKVFTRTRGLPRLRYIPRPSKARREAAIARRAASRGFDAAAPIAVGEERRCGMLHRSFSVIPERPARDLRAILADPATGSKERRSLIEAFASFSRRLHDAGIDQDDFSPNNFLVADDQRFVLIDFERCRIGASLGARRWTLLAKLHRHDLGVSRTDRLRFLRVYLGPGADRGAQRVAWQHICEAFRRVRASDVRHATRSAFQVGRHLAHEDEVWVVRGRERAPVLRLPLPPRSARKVWVRAHQLERLGLPALRPVRLGPDWVELEDPGAELKTGDRESQVRLALRKFDGYGEFVAEAKWAITAQGAKLRDPRAFKLRL